MKKKVECNNERSEVEATSDGWLGYAKEKVTKLLRVKMEEGYTYLKLKMLTSLELHEHCLQPCEANKGYSFTPKAPGYGIEMKEESTQKYEF